MAYRANYIYQEAWFYIFLVKRQLLTIFDHLLKIYFYARLDIKKETNQR